jgi:phosphohistidine phosphatase SixA
VWARRPGPTILVGNKSVSHQSASRRHGTLLLLTAAAWLSWSAASAQSLSGDELVNALRQGGYVLVIRNARSPDEPPEQLAPANLNDEREIDDYGQGQMSVLGYAFRELAIPIGHTLTSPAYRSRQSANYLGFGEQMPVAMLAEDADASWLAGRVEEAPPAGENTVIVTHGSLIERTLGRAARDISTAETLIYRPGGEGSELVARLTIEDWAKLAVD